MFLVCNVMFVSVLLLLLGTVTVAEVKVKQSKDDDLRETTPTNRTLALTLTLALTMLVMEAVVSGRTSFNEAFITWTVGQRPGKAADGAPSSRRWKN